MEKALPYLTTGAPQVEVMSSASFLVCPFETHTWIWIEIIVKYISFFSKWQARASRDIKWARTFLMQSFYFRFPLPGSNDKKIYVWFPPPDKIAPEQAAIARERVPRRYFPIKSYLLWKFNKNIWVQNPPSSAWSRSSAWLSRSSSSVVGDGGAGLEDEERCRGRDGKDGHKDRQRDRSKDKEREKESEEGNHDENEKERE